MLSTEEYMVLQFNLHEVLGQAELMYGGPKGSGDGDCLERSHKTPSTGLPIEILQVVSMCATQLCAFVSTLWDGDLRSVQ